MINKALQTADDALSLFAIILIVASLSFLGGYWAAEEQSMEVAAAQDSRCKACMTEKEFSSYKWIGIDNLKRGSYE